MANVCEICGKGSSSGNTVSKSKQRLRKVWKPNLVKVKTEIDGTVMSIKMCTRCLKTTTCSGMLVKKV